MGAGAGYWAWQLTQTGISVDVSDLDPPVSTFVPVRPAAAADAGALLLVWPELDDSMAADALQAFTGDFLIYCGEAIGGCTGDDDYFELLEGWDQIAARSRHIVWETLRTP